MKLRLYEEATWSLAVNIWIGNGNVGPERDSLSQDYDVNSEINTLHVLGSLVNTYPKNHARPPATKINVTQMICIRSQTWLIR